MPRAPKRRSPLLRIARFVLVTLVVSQLVYLLVVNVALHFDLIPKAARKATQQELQMHWDSAYSLWWGHVTVDGFRMQIDDTGSVQVDLAVDEATVDVALHRLLSRAVVFEKIRARGVSYRMVTKVNAETAKNEAERVAAFPVIEGPGFSAIKPETAKPKPTKEDIANLIHVELLDTQGEIRELWFDEYRYLGPASVRGEFIFEPLESVFTGPDTLRLDGGALSTGKHVLAPHFAAAIECTIRPTHDIGDKPLGVLANLSASIKTNVWLEDLATAGLYADDLELRGRALLMLDIATVDGKVTRSSKLKLTTEKFEAHTQGIVFKGHPTVEGGVTDADKLRIDASLDGEVTTRLIDEKPLAVGLGNAVAELHISTANLAAPPDIERLSVRVGEARIADASLISQEAGKRVPVIGPAVLGSGPLTASVSALVTPEYQLIRLKQSKLGGASLEGAAVRTNGKWKGAGAGKFGALPLGFQLDGKTLSPKPFVDSSWLPAELEKAKIQPAPTGS